MKEISITEIRKRKYSGPVYNIELESDDSNGDDLFWIEQDTGIVTHNCLPKDVNAIIHYGNELGCDMSLLEICWKYNLKIRKDINWASIKGAVSEEG